MIDSKLVFEYNGKTKLTLKQIRKLRRMMDVRNYEKKEHLAKVREQYSAANTAQAAAS